MDSPLQVTTHQRGTYGKGLYLLAWTSSPSCPFLFTPCTELVSPTPTPPVRQRLGLIKCLHSHPFWSQQKANAGEECLTQANPVTDVENPL